MIIAKCVGKIRNKNNIIIGYKLIDKSGQYAEANPNRLKDAIRANQITVVNLKLTSDGRLIDNTNYNNKANENSDNTLNRLAEKFDIITTLMRFGWLTKSNPEICTTIDKILRGRDYASKFKSCRTAINIYSKDGLEIVSISLEDLLTSYERLASRDISVDEVHKITRDWKEKHARDLYSTVVLVIYKNEFIDVSLAKRCHTEVFGDVDLGWLLLKNDMDPNEKAIGVASEIQIQLKIDSRNESIDYKVLGAYGDIRGKYIHFGSETLIPLAIFLDIDFSDKKYYYGDFLLSHDEYRKRLQADDDYNKIRDLDNGDIAGVVYAYVSSPIVLYYDYKLNRLILIQIGTMWKNTEVEDPFSWNGKGEPITENLIDVEHDWGNTYIKEHLDVLNPYKTGTCTCIYSKVIDVLDIKSISNLGNRDYEIPNYLTKERFKSKKYTLNKFISKIKSKGNQ